jgi:hypothetical protein
VPTLPKQNYTNKGQITSDNGPERCELLYRVNESQLVQYCRWRSQESSGTGEADARVDHHRRRKHMREFKDN